LVALLSLVFSILNLLLEGLLTPLAPDLFSSKSSPLLSCLPSSRPVGQEQPPVGKSSLVFGPISTALALRHRFAEQ
jgi:hypothetical protein